MKVPPKGSEFEYQVFPRSEYLKNMLGRLDNEVGYYIDLIENNPHPSGAGVGFWSGVRMIMPAVEALAEIEQTGITDFMGAHLNIPAPKLTWAMFRHALIHNDQLQHAQYDGRTINWGVSLTMGTGHIMAHDQIHVDVKTLYQDLRTYLQSAVAQNDETPVKVAVGFKYNHPPVGIIVELGLLKS
jgi:hypothetical protein